MKQRYRVEIEKGTDSSENDYQSDTNDKWKSINQIIKSAAENAYENNPQCRKINGLMIFAKEGSHEVERKTNFVK